MASTSICDKLHYWLVQTKTIYHELQMSVLCYFIKTPSKSRKSMNDPWKRTNPCRMFLQDSAHSKYRSILMSMNLLFLYYVCVTQVSRTSNISEVNFAEEFISSSVSCINSFIPVHCLKLYFLLLRVSIYTLSRSSQRAAFVSRNSVNKIEVKINCFYWFLSRLYDLIIIKLPKCLSCFVICLILSST